MYYSKDYKNNSLVIKDKMITSVHVEGAYVTWKGEVRFLRFVDEPNTINIKNSNSKLSAFRIVFTRVLFSRRDLAYH